MTMQVHTAPSLELDAGTVAEVVEQIAATGDFSRLSDAQRGKVVLATCKALRLNPLAKPFDFIRLNGKLVMYALRGCTDQLAAVHRINRRITRGPEVVDILGKKAVIAVCEATMPNGRVEQATATCDVADACGVFNVLMKVETKAKRRATLAILGLAVLDEMEVSAIEQEPRRAAPTAREEPEGSRAFARFCDVIDSVPGCVAVWGEYSDLQRGLHEEGADVAEYLDGPTGGYARAANRLRALCPLTEAEIRAVLSARDGELAADLDGMDATSLDAAARWWLGGGKPEDATRAAVVWRALARKASGVDVDPVATGKATKALKAACAALTPPEPPTGTDAPAASEHMAAEGAAAQSDGADWTRSTAGMRSHLASKSAVKAVLNSVVAHGALRGYATLAAERIQALTGWDLDTCEAQITDAFDRANERRERDAETAAMVRRAA